MIKELKRKYDLRREGEIEVIKSFLYKALYGDCLNIFVYDKITKKVYAGNLSEAGYSKKELKQKIKGEK